MGVQPASCCQCQGIESSFDHKRALKELEAYRENGPANTTRIFLEALRAIGVEGRSLLDVGGGVGALQHELAKAGVSRIVSVEASTAYLETAREEAGRRGYIDRACYRHGDFVDLAPQIETADIVTLDRVICCYHDVESLVGLSAARAGYVYGLVYPRDTWWTKLYTQLRNALFRLQGNPFRIFVHPSQAVEAVIHKNGLRRKFHWHSANWQVAVYQRD